MRRGHHGQIGNRGWIVGVAWWGRGLAGATLAVLSLDLCFLDLGVSGNGIRGGDDCKV